jgi:hypothetical protein
MEWSQLQVTAIPTMSIKDGGQAQVQLAAAEDALFVDMSTVSAPSESFRDLL